MRVKIGNTVYSSDEEPIMILMTEEEKELIANMAPADVKFAIFPEDLKISVDDMKKWMSE